jgi:hypothetical protein
VKATTVDLKCDNCRHLRSRHEAKAGRCTAKRSVPGGRVYPCDCERYVVRFERESALRGKG